MQSFTLVEETRASSVKSAWFAIHVRTNHEKTVATMLAEKEFDRFLPLYRARRQWSDRVKRLELPLFPGYLFCRFNPDRSRTPILAVPGVLRIVGAGRKPSPIDETEMFAIRSVVASCARVHPCHFFKVGQRVRVCDGPLRGVEGVVVQTRNGRRLVASITLLQRSVSVELDKESLNPLD